MPMTNTAGGGAITNFTEAVNTSTPNATIPVVSLTATNAATNVDMALVPKGTGAITLQIADNTTTGGNKRGTGAIDLNTTRAAATQVASGLRSFLGPYGSGTASGANSVCFGSGTASGPNAVAFHSSTSSGTNSFSACGNGTTSGNNAAGFGDAVSVSATRGFGAGYDLTVSGQGTVGFGQGGSDRGVASTMFFAPNSRTARGDRQYRKLMQCTVTTNTTPTVLTTTAAAESTTNTWVIPNNYGGIFTGWILARNTANNDQIAWRFEGMVTRDGTAATVALLGAVTPTAVGTADAGMSTCVLAVGVNTTNGSVIVTATGIAATTIHWNGWIDCSENG